MTPSRMAEADAASRAFHAALARLGVAATGDALRAWESIPLRADSQRAVEAWLRTVLRTVGRARQVALALAIAYYRLVRALRTGYTIADPNSGTAQEAVSLRDLRMQFARAAGTSLEEARLRPGGELVIPVEDLDAPDTEQDLDLPGELDRQERSARQEAGYSLPMAGPESLRKKLEKIDDSKPAREVDAEREEAHEKAGRQQAATVSRLAMNGARGALWSMSQRDRRVIGWARLSRTGTPCGWCAMLISRGFVRKDLYRSQRGAGPTRDQLESGEYADGDKYHNNCQCYAEAIYADEQWTSDLFALNRRYAKEWPEVTRGLSGKDAIAAWRKHIRDQNAAALEARQTTNVQEA